MQIEQASFIQNSVSTEIPDRISNTANSDQEKVKEFARNFESVFLSLLLDQMSVTVDTFNDDKDGASKQIDGIFRMQLAQNMSENGSLGLAKGIEQYVSHTLGLDTLPDVTEGAML